MLLNEILISRIEFIDSFGADGDYHSQCEYSSTYLNKSDGELDYAWTNKEKMVLELGEDFVTEIPPAKELKKYPDRYLEIAPMSHSAHHHILQSFLNSRWTNEQERANRVEAFYYPRKSIGYWLRSVGDDAAVEAYRRFAEIEIRRLAEDYLKRNGVVNYEWV